MFLRCGLLLAAVCVMVAALTQQEQMVLTALRQAQRNLQSRSQFLKSDNRTNSQRANSAAAALQPRGDLLQETTKILVQQYGSGVLNRIGGVDVNRLIDQYLR